MKEVSIRLRPLPSSDWVTHDPGCGTSIVSIEGEAHKHDGPLHIVGVYLNGVPLRHRITKPLSVVVSPMLPLQGDRLEVRCLTPRESLRPTLEGPQIIQAPTVSTHSGYGLQAPSRPSLRHPR